MVGGLTKEGMEELAWSLLKDCDSILDVGCGIGGFIERDPNRIAGIDNNPHNVRRCKDKGFSVKNGDASTKMPMNIINSDKTYKGIHCSHVIEHMLPDDAIQMLYNMDKWVAPGGTIVIRTPIMHASFYDDFSHIKPYYPGALRHYFLKSTPIQSTYGKLKGDYREIKFTWRAGKNAYLIAFQKNQ